MIWDATPATDRIIAAVIALGLGLATPAVALAQQSGSAKGQFTAPAWGQFQGTIGGSGWQFNRTLQPGVPAGAVLDANQVSGGPGTGTMFTPPDTRRLGRTAR